MTPYLRPAIALHVTLAILAMNMAIAEPSNTIHLELNKLQPSPDGCQTHLVLHNDRASELQSLKLEFAVFGTDGVVQKSVALPISFLPPGKTRYQAFVLDDLPCGVIGRILLNDVRDCHDRAGPLEECLSGLILNNRTDVPFIQSLTLSALGQAAAVPSGLIHLELNKLQPSPDGCQTHLVLHNDRASELQSLKLEFAVFGTDGVVQKSVALPVSFLPPGKTRYQAFVLDDLPCGVIGRILLNDVRDCHDRAGPLEGCLGGLILNNLTTVPFIQ